MLTVTVTVDTDVFDALQETARRSPGLVGTLTKRSVAREKARLREQLLDEPASPALPFVWSLDEDANARARAWYFANKATGTGGRYPRTGALIEAYEFEVDVNNADGIITITNDAEGAEFVIGDRQVPGHADTWPRLEETAFEASERLTDILIENWFTATDITAGAR